MTLINTVAVIVLAMVLFATVCSGKGNFDDIDSSGSDITEMKRPAFYGGSRYGRSQYNSGINNLRVVPRRVFNFSRYGKRGGGGDSNDRIRGGSNLDNTSPTIQCYENVRDYVLTCSFTGVQDYYRCWKGQENKFTAFDKDLAVDVDEKNDQTI